MNVHVSPFAAPSSGNSITIRLVDPGFLLFFFSNFSSISLRSRLITEFHYTRNWHACRESSGFDEWQEKHLVILETRRARADDLV